MDIFGTDYPTPDGTCVRDYIHVTDLVEAHELLLDYLRARRREHDAQLRLRAGLFRAPGDRHGEAVSGVDFRVDEGPRRAGDPAAITATGEKVRAELGWVPEHDDLREIVTTALEWERYLMTRNR